MELKKSIILTDEKLDNKLESQIKIMDNNDLFTNLIFAPDVHAGKFFPNGFYAEIDKDKGFMPSLLGNDIGCGVSWVKFECKKKDLDFNKLDKFIRFNIPTGQNIHTDPLNHLLELFKNHLKEKCIYDFNADIDENKMIYSIGTLGSGNHFIEVGKNENDEYFLFVHTGSRKYGQQLLNYYLDKAKVSSDVYELGLLDKQLAVDYFIDQRYMGLYAELNRLYIVDSIMKEMKWQFSIKKDNYDYILSKSHNIINCDMATNKKFICKGCYYSLYDGSIFPININSKEGTILIKVNKGKVIPHGAGRRFARSEVANNYTVNQYKKDMSGIYSTTISKDTLDEAPFAYRNKEYIKHCIEKYDLGTIIDEITPIYNFKPGN